ncbi:GNAT family N-acetyltransferase [Sporosarcina pasteurii]|uniref:Ribosomal N-acetyltransferase YdaF n=1 Tax=Sporosarcina pasteurii TaxID=1474 RepID=A0A380CD65_SPOPA|nr:GNAT family protein [Sporosarcina pasteurii]MDS9473349.1 GNAT family protein [Sporosarcina pasteurii]QBQ04270.1 N-acetyltransferase [Sporosarcina pasteurii]SUJ16969.1 Putative ribosomal N-acetyltransferase YdaF [Sporosarcina pasteurii]
MILLEGEKCYLRILTEDDATMFTKVLIANKKYWSVFEPRQEPGFYTVSRQREKIRESIYQMRDRREYNFGIFDAKTSELIGHISLYSIKRLPFSSGFVGYSIDERQIGRGIGTEALRLVTAFAFNSVALHRVEAYVSPRNAGSIAVLEKSGYLREGLLRKILYINGVWEDHYMYAILEDDF